MEGDEKCNTYSRLEIRHVTDNDIRIERLNHREKQKFGNRIMPEDDMYTNHTEFIEWAGKYDTDSVDMRGKAKHDEEAYFYR